MNIKCPFCLNDFFLTKKERTASKHICYKIAKDKKSIYYNDLEFYIADFEFDGIEFCYLTEFNKKLNRLDLLSRDEYDYLNLIDSIYIDFYSCPLENNLEEFLKTYFLFS